MHAVGGRGRGGGGATQGGLRGPEPGDGMHAVGGGGGCGPTHGGLNGPDPGEGMHVVGGGGGGSARQGGLRGPEPGDGMHAVGGAGVGEIAPGVDTGRTSVGGSDGATDAVGDGSGGPNAPLDCASCHSFSHGGSEKSAMPVPKTWAFMPAEAPMPP